jgi:hypothetical protein
MIQDGNVHTACDNCHFMMSAAICSNIVRDECRKRGIPYNEYPTLPSILSRFQRYMKVGGCGSEARTELRKSRR